jgi:hypothetical protein
MTQNRVLNNGLFVVSTKEKKNNLVNVVISDFTQTSRFLFDMDNKKLLGNDAALILDPKDAELLLLIIKSDMIASAAIATTFSSTPENK